MCLKELCRLLKLQESSINKDLVFSKFFHSIKDGYSENIVDGFSDMDLVDLDIHSLCHVLAIYEYIVLELGVESNITGYEKVSCPKDSNEIYLSLLECMSEENAEELYHKWLENSMEPFKSRGIIAKEFNYTV